jgi:2-iminobutanoate/2-iminopropanoate deaminase
MVPVPPEGNQAPKPLGPYSPIVRAGEWLICSGQVGIRDGQLLTGIDAQVTQALANVKTLLESAGAQLTDVVKATVFLTDMENFKAMNEAYLAAFGDHRPARSAFAVAGLPMGADVEIEVWAFTNSGRSSS